MLANLSVARGLGFEPRQSDSESEVLPLDDPRKAGAFSHEIIPKVLLKQSSEPVDGSPK